MSMFMEKTNIAHPSRTEFYLSNKKVFNCTFGEIIPVFCRMVVPGDSVKLGNITTIRFEAQAAPFMTDVVAETHYYFVSFRNLAKNWAMWITGGRNGDYGEKGSQEDWTHIYPICQYLNDEFQSDPFYGGYWEDNSEIEGFTDEPRRCQYNSNITADEKDGIVENDRMFSHAKYKKYSLEDYLGFPLGVDLTSVSRFPQLAYNFIWNNYFRDENVQAPVGQGCDKILHCNWERDYFTSASIKQQRGISPSFGLTNGIAPVGWLDQAGTNPTFREFFTTIYSGAGDTFEKFATGYNQTTGQISRTLSTGTSNITINPLVSNELNAETKGGQSKRNTPILADVTQALVNFNINDIRTAFQVQKFMERSMTGGYRYGEWLQVMYGTAPKDETLNMPVYIGGTKQKIITSEVQQTMEQVKTNEQGQTELEGRPLGSLGGHSMSVAGNYAGSYYSNEFGLIMGLMFIRPKTQYFQGVSREWTWKNKYELFNPLFVNLSQQAIKNGELYWTQDKDDSGEYIRDKPFGFQGRYDELRTAYDQVCGDMRPSIPGATGIDQPYYWYWTLAREFGEQPKLSKEFLECKIENPRIFAVTNPDYKQIQVEFGNAVTMMRPLPYASIPGLIDHN